MYYQTQPLWWVLAVNNERVHALLALLKRYSEAQRSSAVHWMSRRGVCLSVDMTPLPGVRGTF